MHMIQGLQQGLQPALLHELPGGGWLLQNSFSVDGNPEGRDARVVVSSDYLGISDNNGASYTLWPATLKLNSLTRPFPPKAPHRELELHVVAKSLQEPKATGLEYRRLLNATNVFEHEVDVVVDGVRHGFAFENNPQQRTAEHKFMLAGAIFYTPIPEQDLSPSANRETSLKYQKAKLMHMEKQSDPRAVIQAYSEAIEALTSESHGFHKSRTHRVKLLMAHSYLEQAKLFIKMGRGYYKDARECLWKANRIFSANWLPYANERNYLRYEIQNLFRSIGDRSGIFENMAFGLRMLSNRGKA